MNYRDSAFPALRYHVRCGRIHLRITCQIAWVILRTEIKLAWIRLPVIFIARPMGAAAHVLAALSAWLKSLTP